MSENSPAVEAWAARLSSAEPADALDLLEALAGGRHMRNADLGALVARLHGLTPPPSLSRAELIGELARPYHEALAAAAKAAALKGPGSL